MQTFDDARGKVLASVRQHMSIDTFANIVIAGPLFSGIEIIAHDIQTSLHFRDCEPQVTIFSQKSYMRKDDEIEDTPFGVKNYDAKSSYNTKKFVKDVRIFYERGSVGGYGEDKKILSTLRKLKINIIIGPHVIDLLSPNRSDTNSLPIEIPKVEFLYLTTDHDACMLQREKSMLRGMYNVKRYQEYSRFIEEQNRREIEIQEKMADWVIRYN